METKTTCPYIFSLKLIKLLASCLVLTKPSPFAKKFQFLSDHEKREKKKNIKDLKFYRIDSVRSWTYIPLISLANI